MRGKGTTTMCRMWAERITPAYAGKRYLACVEVAKIQDHPRLCGEKASSFPPVIAGFRITPAYAGKSCLCC